MTLRITDDCIECQACLEVCAHQAISQMRVAKARPQIAVDPSACTHCWPFEQRPRCVNVCPVGCIVVDPDQPVPPFQLIMHELESVLSVAGPFEAARMIAQVRQWVREWFVATVCDGSATIELDKILDFYSFLALMEREFSPCDPEIAPATMPPMTIAGPRV